MIRDWKFMGIWRRAWCHIVAGSVALFVVVPLTFMALERADPVIMHGYKLSGDFRPGGTVELQWTATARKYCSGEVRSRIIASDGVIYEYARAPVVIRSSTQEKGTYAFRFPLPPNIASGTARREAHVSYYCNPLQKWLDWPIRVVRRYGPIEVVPPWAFGGD